MHTFIDLFCGVGGFRLALEQEGLECVFSSDVDKDAREAYYENFGETPKGDITEIMEKEIPEHDVLCAGFPCQPFSVSGKRGGMSDPRGKLFYEIVRIAKYHQPKALLLENVKNILTIDGGKTVQTIQEKLSEIGYALKYYLLNASHFGVPQARERVYFVALLQDKRVRPQLTHGEPLPTNEAIYLEDVLEETVDERLVVSESLSVRWVEGVEETPKLAPIRIGSVNKGGQGERVYSIKGHAVTQSAFGGGVGARTGLYKTPQGVRRLSISECKRVMGFHNGHFVKEGAKGYQQLGNAVIPAMVAHVWRSVKVV